MKEAAATLRINLVKRIRILPTLLLFMLLTACSSTTVLEAWPEDLPPQQLFIAEYRADAENAGVQPLRTYLNWVRRFYQGSSMMPNGWNDMTEAAVNDLPPPQRQQAVELREQLGILIAAEWAKDNNVRLINTSMLGLWGNIMAVTEQPEERLPAMEMILQDVVGLLNHSLSPQAITERRYEQRLNISLDSYF